MRNVRWWVLFLAGCGPPVSKDVLVGVSDELARVGHPFGTFRSVEVVDWKRGDPETRRRWADVEVRYVRGIRPEPNTMLVRVYQESVAPCRIALDVLSDDGPDPFLLDNPTASDLIGRRLCRMIEAE